MPTRTRSSERRRRAVFLPGGVHDRPARRDAADGGDAHPAPRRRALSGGALPRGSGPGRRPDESRAARRGNATVGDRQLRGGRAPAAGRRRPGPRRGQLGHGPRRRRKASCCVTRAALPRLRCPPKPPGASARGRSRCTPPPSPPPATGRRHARSPVRPCGSIRPTPAPPPCWPGSTRRWQAARRPPRPKPPPRQRRPPARRPPRRRR